MPDGVQPTFGDGSALGSVGVTSGAGIGACALMRICAHAVLGVGGVSLNAIAIHVFRKLTCGTWFVNGIIARDAMLDNACNELSIVCYSERMCCRVHMKGYHWIKHVRPTDINDGVPPNSRVVSPSSNPRTGIRTAFLWASYSIRCPCHDM